MRRADQRIDLCSALANDPSTNPWDLRVASPYLLGIDTGGTYTDAVLFKEDEGVIAKAKALTTRHDLSLGIAGAVDAVLAQAELSPIEIGLVSISTTLATNALVEGQGSRAALVMIGFDPGDLHRGGLAEALGDDPVIFLRGGHDAHGNETPLDLTPLEGGVRGIAAGVTSFAVAGYFAVRNPAHELAVRDHLRELTHLPVTCSHQLSSKLGGPRRALTTLLNARLVSVLDRLVGACETFLAQRGISAPLMVVRGDGALIAASEARLRPIETILSGPAASLVGASYLTGLGEAVVSDIGGTTTDVAVLDGGRPKLAEEGAVVGGHQTMVEAVALRTYGLGGDSEVHIDERGLEAKILLGPRRVLPLSLLAQTHREPVLAALDKQLRATHAGRHDGRFAIRTGLPDAAADGLPPSDRAVFERVLHVPVALNELLAVNSHKAVLDRLVARGLVHLSGITPSDAMHVLGRQSQWCVEAARLALDLAGRRKDGSGRPIATSAEALAEKIVARLTRQSAEAVLATCLAEDGAGAIDPATSLAVDRALKREPGIARFSLALDRPLVGLGASAAVYYPAVAAMLGAHPVIPDDADVANAIGAVVGQIRATVTVVVTSPEEGRFILAGAGSRLVFTSEADAVRRAHELASQAAVAQARADGADEAVVSLTEDLDAADVEGSRKLVEARVTAVATGRPRIAAG
jgi:N-methylhydantoinase A/oxoprolinase/acetone carboxylase beta subunit